jgi:hypothetical protein
MPPLGRWATALALVVLLLDAALLGAVAVSTGRPLFYLLAGAGLAGAAGVGLLWRRQRRRWEEVSAARAAAQRELRALARALRESRPAE